jgi:hypothetical protein
VAVDNRSSDLASYDTAALLELLESLDDLSGTGYDEAYVSALAESASEPSAPDDFPSFDEDLETQYKCPKCDYEWSGKPS